jgi:hypothetical protein
MRLKNQLLILIICCLVGIPGCKSQEFSIQNTEPTVVGHSIEMINDKRNETAFQAYQVAQTIAKEWSSEAILLEIPPTTIVAMNIPVVNLGPYWFFVFGKLTNDRELYVAVSDGKIFGSFQAQPMANEKQPYLQSPLEVSKLIDSDVAFQKCIDGNYINLDQIKESNSQIDYRLISINDEPVWSIFIAGSDPFEPLCNVNAYNGEITEDPFLPYN